MAKGFGKPKQSSSYKRVLKRMQKLRRLGKTFRLDSHPDEELKKGLGKFFSFFDESSTDTSDSAGNTIDMALKASGLPESRYPEVLMWLDRFAVAYEFE